MMARYRVPTHLICLGGGGNDVGETFMSQRWILEEVLRDDPNDGADAPDTSQGSLEAFFIDTDGSTLPNELPGDIETDVDAIREEYELKNPPTVEGTIVNISQGTHSRYLSSNHIAAEATIGDLMSDLGLKAWWIDRSDQDSDNQDPLLEPLTGLQSGGVDRKRGLTKAISRIGEWEGDPLETVERSVETHKDPHVAIVVGLGGGTGSGLVVDLARRLHSAGGTLTLFGVLPAPSGDDGSNVLANAYGMLSELEYLALTHENYFKNMLLLPFDPHHDTDIYDKAATYTITSYYNLHGDQSNTYMQFNEFEDNEGPPTFAPFTLASTRFLHYLNDDIEDTRDNFQTLIDQKHERLTAEAELYDQIEAYIHEYHPYAEAALHGTTGTGDIRLPSEDALELKGRIDSLQRLLSQDFLNEIEFWSAGRLVDTLEQATQRARKNAEPEDESEQEAAIARDLIPRLANHTGDVASFRPDDGGWTANEQEFVEAVLTEFTLIARRAGIIRAINTIRDAGDETDEAGDLVAADLENAIDEDDQGIGAEIESEIETKRSQKQALIDEIESLEGFVEALRTDPGELASIKTTWEQAVTDTIDTYYTLYTKRKRITELLEALETEIEQELETLEEQNNASNILVNGSNFEDYGELNTLLNDIGVEEIDEKATESSIKKVQRIRQKQLRAQERNNSLKETLLSLAGYGTISGLRNDYERIRGQISTDIIEVTSWSEQFAPSLNSEYIDSRLEKVETTTNDLIDQVDAATQSAVEQAEELVSDPTWADDTSEARTLLSDLDVSSDDAAYTAVSAHLTSEDHSTIDDVATSTQLVEALKTGPLTDQIERVTVDRIQDLITRKSDTRDSIEATLESYRTLSNIVSGPGGRYESRTSGILNPDEITIPAEGQGADPFRQEIKPASRGRLGSGTLATTDLWSHENERVKITEELEDLVPEVGGEFLPVAERQIADAGTKQVEYYESVLATAFMSPIFDEFDDDGTAEIPEVTDNLATAPQYDPDNYFCSRGSFADELDFAMTSFMSGVFLDNLSVFTNHCKPAFEQTRDVSPESARYVSRDSVPRMIQHYTYGIDGVTYHTENQFLPDETDGGFVYRKDVLNFDADGTEQLLDHDEQAAANYDQVTQMLLDDYYQIVGYPSTIDPS